MAAQYAPRHADVDDLVSEAFAQVFRLLQQGKGPDEFFRAYLFTCVRHLAARGREAQGKVQPTDDDTVLDQTIDHPDANLEFIERQLITDAYQALPERWRTVLWYLEVEGLKPAEIAEALGLTPNGVAALAYRAREGLRQAYLQSHVSGQLPQSCLETGQMLGAYTRDSLAGRDKAKVEDHLATCEECNAVVAELGEVNQSLRAVIGPLVLGALAAPLLESLKSAPPMAGTAAAASASLPAAQEAATKGASVAARAPARGLRRLFSFSTKPVLATVAWLGAAALLFGIGLGSVALLRNAPWSSGVPTPVSVDVGPPAIDTGPDAMVTILVIDGHLAVTATGSSLTVPPGGGEVSSSAQLDLPAGVSVQRAELAWATNEPAKDWWNVSLTGPDGSTQKVSAQRRAVLEQGAQLSADVTAFVESSGAGLWRFGDLKMAAPGEQVWAGWALTVIYVDPDLPMTRVSLLEGNLPVEPAEYVNQPVDAPSARLASVHAVVWGARDPGGVTVWLADEATNGELSQGYPVEAMIPGPPQGIDLLRGAHAYFPEGEAGQVTPAVSFRAVQASQTPPSVGLLTLASPLEP